MPLENHILKTKLLHVNENEVQRTLKQLKNMPEEVTLKGRSLFIKGKKLGEIKPKYDSFLFSLHNPRFETSITGGHFRLLDENGKYIRTFRESHELTAYQREMLTMCYYRVSQNQLGCNVMIVDEYAKQENIIPF